MDSKDHKEVGGGIFNKPVDEVWHTPGSYTTSSTRRIDDNEEGRGIFDGNGLSVTINMDTERRKGAYRTAMRSRRR